MDRQLLSIESSDRGLLQTVSGLAAALDGRGTVFTPLPVVRPEARMAPVAPPVVVVAFDDSSAAPVVADWASQYLGRYPDAVLTCACEGRSVRLDAANRDTAREELARLIPE
ncbi:hypothetical protein [Pseudonocardia asaccharolytica]|uniref:Uncharacterized protein n=1 Tax=Pseudonocardia asaccharolytica DSM 44247 = NBRC 16224 TaxID=1123024 RepID=A0A511D957_9PSEU|nr:hypothetical protein [Pseudonocardia asaccharolytica]GEL19488.1 hypothetical protein PA7_33250 [Pseudonocardia asaccharolytica DSM 44247 = NBRC 16224]